MLFSIFNSQSPTPTSSLSHLPYHLLLFLQLPPPSFPTSLSFYSSHLPIFLLFPPPSPSSFPKTLSFSSPTSLSLLTSHLPLFLMCSLFIFHPLSCSHLPLRLPPRLLFPPSSPSSVPTSRSLFSSPWCCLFIAFCSSFALSIITAISAILLSDSAISDSARASLGDNNMTSTWLVTWPH